MSYVLVTGGSGFIGSHLCEKLLDLNYKVINLDNFNDFYSTKIKRNNIANVINNENYKLIKGDIRNKKLLTNLFANNDITAVVHLAAMAGVRTSINKPIAYIKNNIEGTVNLLDALKKSNVKKFIFASSSSVYGANASSFSEDAFLDTLVSPYGDSKQCGEIFCKTYNTLYKIPTVILRFFTVYGPRQRPEMAIHKFTKAIDKGKHITILGDGSSSRDYTYIDDIVNGIISSINFECNFEIFNLGNSKPVNINDLVNIIGNTLEKPVLARYTDSNVSDVNFTCADISKAQRLLGYSPTVSIEDGVKRFIEWYNPHP